MQEAPVGDTLESRSLWSFKFDTDDIEDYVKDKYQKAKGYIKTKVTDASGYLTDMLEDDQKKTDDVDGGKHDFTDEEKDIYEKIDEIDDSVEDLSDK